jgi:site-specific DNA-methyltransferase (adenine-specific)
MYKLIPGDCINSMQSLEDNSIDSVVVDPPYHLTSIVKRFGKPGSAPAQFGTDGAYSRHSTGFMGKEWDGGEITQDPKTWEAILRVAKPGAYLLSFGGTRTFHRMMVAIEDAGWEIRDTIMWVYGSGFPKSHNLHEKWEGWGTSLKPAWEPIVMARKPIIGPVIDNMLKQGTGAMNIDSSRIPGESIPINKLEEWSGFGQKERPNYVQEINNKGRWPANLIHDGSEEVLELFPETKSGKMGPNNTRHTDRSPNGIYGRFDINYPLSETIGDSGSAARFFYCAKANQSERNAGLEEVGITKNKHPTVKPIALMRYLVTLVTQPGGMVLDCFCGSGSTGVAAVGLGFNFIGMDSEPDYLKIAEARIKHAELQCSELPSKL